MRRAAAVARDDQKVAQVPAQRLHALVRAQEHAPASSPALVEEVARDGVVGVQLDQVRCGDAQIRGQPAAIEAAMLLEGPVQAGVDTRVLGAVQNGIDPAVSRQFRRPNDVPQVLEMRIPGHQTPPLASACFRHSSHSAMPSRAALRCDSAMAPWEASGARLSGSGCGPGDRSRRGGGAGSAVEAAGCTSAGSPPPPPWNSLGASWSHTHSSPRSRASAACLNVSRSVIGLSAGPHCAINERNASMAKGSSFSRLNPSNHQVRSCR